MTQILFEGVVDTDYGQFDIVWSDSFGFDGNFDRYFSGQVNGLAGAADPDELYMVLARRSGGSDMRIELCETEPELLDAEWADVVEVSVVVPADSSATWTSWAGETGGPLALPPGEYRVRVSAKGRDAGAADEFAEGVIDHYVVQFWPSPPQPDSIVRSDSEEGRYWHREVGGRR